MPQEQQSTTPLAKSDSPNERPRPGRWRRTAGLWFRAIRNLLALAMVVEIVMVFAPLPERIYNWLSVAATMPGKADYIVCLGGGSGREATAAQLWHRKVAPVVIVSNAPGAAEHMRYLATKAGVPRDKILVDNRSYTTADHPAGLARLPGVDPAHQAFVIVTDHTHTRRARATFVKAGYQNVVMYAGKETPRTTYWDKCQWRVMVIPSLIYESAAMAKYWWQGKI